MAGAARTGGGSRRALLRAVFGLGIVGGTAAVLAPVVRAGRRAQAPPPAAGPEAAAPVVEETYRGRHISVGARAAAEVVPASAGDAGTYTDGTAYDIRIDGRPLHVMRRADGSFMSVVHHYESFPTPLAVARAAVDDLRGAQLSLAGPMSHHV